MVMMIQSPLNKVIQKENMFRSSSRRIINHHHHHHHHHHHGKKKRINFAAAAEKTRLSLTSASFYLPKDNDSKPMGEDAHFICDEKNTIGVADGVGGWVKYGIDSGVYARELMSNSIEALSKSNLLWGDDDDAVNPKEVLEQAYSKTKAEGASTACIITLNGNVLHAANVGDSGFVIIRRGKTVYKSRVQQRGFNCPYQLGNNEKSDRPSSAEVIQVEVENGDVIVAGSDGLFDNMFNKEIESTVRRGLNDGVEAKEIALRLANLALYNSYDRFSVTPFQIAAMEARQSHRGGKIDDISVIVSYVMPKLW